MSVAKVIEISAESKDGFEAAIQEGVRRAGETVKNVKSAWIKEQEVSLSEGNIAMYRVKMKVTFVIN
jgi:flavin-binding protein dodecin